MTTNLTLVLDYCKDFFINKCLPDQFKIIIITKFLKHYRTIASDYQYFHLDIIIL